MELVAGPQGSGKSTFFPVRQSGYDAFNIDDHRKTLNDGSSQGFSEAIQKRAAADYEAFIEGHIRAKRSFSIEVTLGKDIALEQAKRAQAQGFSVRLADFRAIAGLRWSSLASRRTYWLRPGLAGDGRH